MLLRAWLSSVLILSLLMVAEVSHAQYMYLDANGDGLNTSTDRLNVPGGTQVDIWLRTDQNRDGSGVICAATASMTLSSSYEFILKATNGRVQWGAYVNNLSGTMETLFATASDSSEFYIFYGGGGSLPPGLYKLGTLTCMVSSGKPSVEIMATSSFSPSYATAFGSDCSGATGDGLFELGVEWTDADGLAATAFTVVSPFPQTFDYPAGTQAEPWDLAGNPWQSGGSPKWSINTNCGYWLGSYSANAAGQYNCDTYSPGVDNSLSLEGRINVSSLKTYQLSFVERHRLALGDQFNPNDDRLWYVLQAAQDSFGILYDQDAIYDVRGTTQTSWSRITKPALPVQNALSPYNYPYNYARIIFGLQTYRSSPVGTYGAWVDSVQIFGTSYPDIYASGVAISGTSSGPVTAPTADQTWYLRFTLGNRGDTSTEIGFGIDVFVDGAYLANRFETALASNGVRTISWALSGSSISAGQHTVQIRLDSGDLVHESNGGGNPEQNNTLNQTGTWNAPAAPDLIVVNPSPAWPSTAKMGQNIGIPVKVRNQGSANAGSFRVGWYRHRASPPLVNAAPDSSVLVSSGLVSQGEIPFTFFTSSNVARTDSMYVFVDYLDNVLNESNESNNRYGPAIMRWTPKTIVVKGIFQYSDSVWGGVTSTYCNDIELYDWDGTSSPDRVASGVAAQWGTNIFEFPAIVNEDTDDDNGFLDLFVRVNYRSNEACWSNQWPDNKFVEIYNPAPHPDSVWYFDRWGWPNANPSNDTLNVGTLEPTSYGHRAAGHLLKTISHRGWGLVRGHVTASQPILGVRVMWSPGFDPGVTRYDENTSILFVSGTDDLELWHPDEWDDSVVLHEYAHHLSHIFGDYVESPTADSLEFSEHWKAASDDTVAWKEGWADFFGALRGDDPFTAGYGEYSDYGRGPGSVYNRLLMRLEDDTLIVFQPGLATVDTSRTRGLFGRGARWRGAVACALWDVYDANHDKSRPSALGDSLSGGFATMWGALHPTPQVGIEDAHRFRVEYEKKYANPAIDYRKMSFLRRIYSDHGMGWYNGDSVHVISGIEEEPANRPVVRFVGAYPNPFNPHCRLRFYVREDLPEGSVSFRIYDTRGALVRALRPHGVRGGLNEVMWDGKSGNGTEVASGVYICEMIVHGLRDRRKLTVLR